jgi:hypothetical protein
MSYSKLPLRVAAIVICMGAGYFLVSDQLCMPTKGGCRVVRGASAVLLFLSANAFASMLWIASTQPRRGARTKGVVVAFVFFVVLYMSAFVLELRQIS